MSKLSLIAAMALGGLVACSTLVTAQDASNAPEKKGGKRGTSPEQMMVRYTEQLSLTDEQKPKVKTVLEDTMKKRREITKESGQDRQQVREKMQPVMEVQNKKMKEILTADQYKKYQEMNEKMKKRGGKKKAEKTSQ
jgi:Spy/CpxP family protein refolding chaperone